MRVAAIVCVLGCGGKDDAGSAASGSAVAAKPAPGSAKPAVVEKPVDVAVEDRLGVEPGENHPELRYAFDKRVPQLPAISPDGTSLADWDYLGGMPMLPMPVDLAIVPIAGKGKIERLVLVDLAMSSDEQQHEHNWQDSAPSAGALKKLRANADAIKARLDKGKFGSLVSVDVQTVVNSFETKPARVGAFVLASKGGDDSDTLDITLSADGKVVQKERVKTYETKESPASFGGMGFCSYRPFFRQAYTDQAGRRLFLDVGFRHNEECSDPDPKFIVWPLGDDTTAAIAKVMRGQLESPAVLATDAQLVRRGELATRDALEKPAGHVDRDVSVTLSRDGKSAWASLTTKLGDDPRRVSSVLAKSATGWRIVATTWTKPVPDAVADKDAKASKLKAGTFAADAGDASLREAFGKLVTDGIDADAAARGDLIAIGTAQGERVVGGKAFASGWNAAFKGKTALVSSVARVAPGGTTGWVAATLELAKSGYKLPFNAFAVFDKTDKGWSLVHVHFSI